MNERDLVSDQLQVIRKAIEVSDRPKDPEEWTEKVPHLPFPKDIKISDLRSKGSHENLFNSILTLAGLDNRERFLIDQNLESLESPRVDGQPIVVSGPLMVGTIKELEDSELESLGLNTSGIAIVRRLFGEKEG